MSYEVLKIERRNRLTGLAGFGASVIDWMPDVELSQALLQVKDVEVEIMADDVQPQQEGMKTLHLRLLRIQWQVVTLQLISTIALLWMYLKMVDLYIVDSIDHAMAIQFFDTIEFSKFRNAITRMVDWRRCKWNWEILSIMVLNVIGGGMAALAFQNPVIVRRPV